MTFPFVIAHRGAPRLAPENTLAALVAAKKAGATAVECDIQLTKDNVPVILHDANLLRTMQYDRWLSQTPYSMLVTLSAGAWFSKKFKTEKIPLLSEWLRTASDLELLLNLEIKARTENQARLLAEIVTGEITQHYSKKLPLPLISSSNLHVLKNISKNNNKLEQGLITEKSISKDLFSALHKLNVVSVHQHYRLMTPRHIEKLHQHHFRALAYTVNDHRLLAQLKKDGIDGVFSDNETFYKCV